MRYINLIVSLLFSTILLAQTDPGGISIQTNFQPNITKPADAREQYLCIT